MSGVMATARAIIAGIIIIVIGVGILYIGQSIPNQILTIIIGGIIIVGGGLIIAITVKNS